MAKKRLSGAAQMKASGKSAVLIGLTPDEKEVIQQAAALSRQSMASFIALHAARAAKKIVAKDGGDS